MSQYFKNAPVAKEWKRSTFPINPTQASMFTSFNLGDLVPLYEPIEVLPHDTFVFDLGSLIRMPDSINAPIMDGIDFDAYAFFVPKRLVWKYTKEFYGQNDTSSGVSSNVYAEPSVPIWQFNKGAEYSNNSLSESDYINTIASHFGIPYVTAGSQTLASNYSFINILPLRAYFMIWNYYFRDQNLQNPYIVADAGNGPGIYSSGGIVSSSTDPNDSSLQFAFGLKSGLLKACKKHDYFTSMLPYAEKTSSEITLPLGNTAPVKLKTYATGDSYTPTWKAGAVSAVSDGLLVGADSDAGEAGGSAAINAGGVYQGQAIYNPDDTLITDLSEATSSAINVLREALALHRLYEIDAIGGTRYDEQIFAHFGSRPLAETFKPEELGEVHFKINVDQVVAHAGNDTESLGTTGAYSVTGNKSHMVTKSFTEPGYIFILGVARQSTHIYSQGLSPLWSKTKRFDYFYPEFQNMGLLSKKKREIYVANTAADDNTFGFGEYGSDYRIFKPMVTGLLNPNVTGSLDYWTLADELSSSVTLGNAFIQESSANLARCLTTGTSTAQFVGRFGLTGTMTRVVPVYSIPKGL